MCKPILITKRGKALMSMMKMVLEGHHCLISTLRRFLCKQLSLWIIAHFFLKCTYLLEQSQSPFLESASASASAPHLTFIGFYSILPK